MDRPERQSFNDGICHIYAVENGAEAGSLPRERLNLHAGPFRYQERTVGVTRYYAAMREQERIDLVLRIPLAEVSTLDMCIPKDGKQYRIKQVQHPRNTAPPCCDLALEELEASYEFTTNP